MSHDSSRSANSSQRSKRSFNNSTSSNCSKGGGKKTKSSNQKTLGMAWGANSLSSSRSSFRSSPFSDFGSYMSEKNRKLQNQFNSEASTSADGGSVSGKPIFDGISIFVDGFTIPSSQELRGYMLKYGGRFENYFSRSRVTHIICSNLPDSKIKNLRSFSGGLPVVKPAWILDSVVSNKLLNWVPYQLEQLANNQPKLSAFFAMKNRPVADDVLDVVGCQVNMDRSLEVGTSHNNLSEEYDTVKDVQKKVCEYDVFNREIGKPSSRSGNASEVKMAELSKTEDENSVNNESNSRQISMSVSNYNLNDHGEKSPNPAIAGPSYRRHSTLEDPNFMENYFKSSRLHFIGTWRNRYRKRFPSLSNEFRCKNSTIGASDSSQKITIIHIDMDCFFVSVVIRNQPDLCNKPVAVCHSDNPKGTAEISSANYPARKYGVKAGMFVRDAKALCPHLIIFPYNFEAYEEVADQFYDVLHKHCNKVQAVSCDEAFLGITDLGKGDPELVASMIRNEIFETTRCTASAGIADNMLLARLATRTAKPDGQFYIPSEKVDEYLNELPIKELPGIGYVLEEKLKKQNVLTCGQLRLISKDSLQKEFGMKTGEMLWSYCRGIDNRLVGEIQETKSVGAEVNWGVRFKNSQDSQQFLLSLCKEVSLRLQGCGLQGRAFTLKIKKKRKDAGEPTKFMGCGVCDNLSHSMAIPIATDDVDVLQRVTKQLFSYFHLDVQDIRGVGLQVSKLQNTDISKQGLERNSLRSWLISASSTKDERKSINSISNEGANSVPPPLHDLDMGVIGSLPPELFSELNDFYGGKLADFISQSKGKSENRSGSSCIPSLEREEGDFSYHIFCNVILVPHGLLSTPFLGTTCYGKAPLKTNIFGPRRIMVENKGKQQISEEPAAAISGDGSYNETIRAPGHGHPNLMLMSLSQVDTSVLQQLPEELRADILGLLPMHREEELTLDKSFVPREENPQKASNSVEDRSSSANYIPNSDLWNGNPPKWVDMFRVNNCLILNTLAEMYYKASPLGNLSSILQRAISKCLYHLDENDDNCGWSEASYYFCELLKQYINLKIEFDIEEIYVCFCLLRRFKKKSKFFLQVYGIVFPYLQASVGEHYGGNLDISLE